jgi:Cu/Ag efflux protein CusF
VPHNPYKEVCMTRIGICAATLLLTTAALAGETAKPMAADAPKGEAIIGTHEATATVTKIDMKTREVTVKTEDGEEVTFVADERVKNLPQVKVGDTIRAVYTEAIAYEVKKGGKAPAVETQAGGGTAKRGEKPAAAVGQQVTVTVTVTAIDPKNGSVTFMGPRGNTQTVKVRHPEKLQGVAVGDSVEITYSEALAVKVEAAAKKM